MKKEITIAVLATIVAVFLILVFIGLVTPDDKEITSSSEKQSEIFKTNFIDGCMEENKISYNMCKCSYDQLEKVYGYDGLLDMSVEYLKTGELPEKAVDAVLTCIE